MEEKEPYQRTNPKQREKERERETRWKVRTYLRKKLSTVEKKDTVIVKQQTITTWVGLKIKIVRLPQCVLLINVYNCEDTGTLFSLHVHKSLGDV